MMTVKEWEILEKSLHKLMMEENLFMMYVSKSHNHFNFPWISLN